MAPRDFSHCKVFKKSNAESTLGFFVEVVTDYVRRNVCNKTQHYLNALHTAALLLQKRTASWKSIIEADDALISPAGTKNRAKQAAPRAQKDWQIVRDKMTRTQSDNFRDVSRNKYDQVCCSVL